VDDPAVIDPGDVFHHDSGSTSECDEVLCLNNGAVTQQA